VLKLAIVSASTSDNAFQREDVTSAAAAQNVVQPVSQMKYRFEQA
jgi:hypothetical protein